MKQTPDDFSTKFMYIIQEYWNTFLATLPRITIALLVLVTTIFIAIKVSRLVNRRLAVKAPDPLFSSFIVQLLKHTMILVGAMISLQIAGLSGIAGGLLAGAGVSALIIGFAFKDIGENFIAGIILAFNRPFHYHDTIKVADYLGRVEGLSFRMTHLKTFDEKDVFVPNSMIVKGILTNLTRDGMLRLDFTIGIAFEDSLNDAIKLITQTIVTYNNIMVEPPPFAVVEAFTASTANIRIFFWTSTDDYRRGVLVLKSEIMIHVKDALLENGFTLPADIHELRLYNKENSIPVTILKTS